jgi:hypothetical protein
MKDFFFPVCFVMFNVFEWVQYITTGTHQHFEKSLYELLYGKYSNFYANILKSTNLGQTSRD